MGLPPHRLCLFFPLLYFFLSVFEVNDLLFWVPDVLCQHSNVVLWSLLSVEMFFWWICEGVSDLPNLFLCHLRTAPWTTFFFFCKSIMFSLFKNGVCVCICVYFFACVWVEDYSIIVPNLWPSNSPLAVLWIFCPQPYGQSYSKLLIKLSSFPVCVSSSPPCCWTKWPRFLSQFSFFVLIFRASADHYSFVFLPTLAVQKKSQEKLN